MSGQRTGVSTQLKEVEPRALFLHCHGHALNLAAGDAVKGCSVMKDALDITFEVSKLVKFSPKRSGTFDKLKEELATNSLASAFSAKLGGQYVQPVSSL